ncbi:glycoside hydrolase family 28 protein [Sphingobacterium sp. SGR-19]|uniref:glycoside hydrolase family 28 protein n=1 Tax=Sphingobacterium sp. SGR-19 TaxID=2710886 RepID=UPI0013ECFE82|nr:glycoside hydrolase family 28 protein [Sphingobacterium sp. SGR-19]NGM64501.1 glycoside hydrolase family 28 protein [Sphingobacterium sp. SGR-19]
MKALWMSVVVLLCAACGSATKPLQERLDAELPQYDEVGVEVMPEEIALVESPHFEYNFRRPTFPERTDSLRSGATDIQDRIDQLATAGGGTLVLTAGDYSSGRVELKSNVNLHLAEGAVLTFRSEIGDFLPVVYTRNEGIELYSLGACIYAHNAENIAITGKGKLVGPGEGSVRERTMTHEVIEKVVDLDKPIEDRIYDGETEPFIFPPALIAPISCKGVFIEGISLERSAFWNIVPTFCENVIIRGIQVHSKGIPRGDGIDIESSKNVLVEYCSLYTGDDCIAIKAGRGYDGLRANRPSENIVVRYCLAGEGHGGITLGSETAGMIKNLYVHDCAFDGTDVGIRFKTRRPRGGGGQNIVFENIRMNVVHSALRWDMLGSSQHVGAQASRDFAVEVNALTPKFSNVTINNVLIESAADCINVEGIPESRLENVKISNIHATGKRYLTIRDAENFVIRDSEIHCEDCVIDSVHVAGLVQENVTILTK